MIPYRPDIDGLRALAVLSVVLFHIDHALIPGGFIGVDMFFVISGFLITTIIDREMRAGTFTFAGFYERRIRRILPACFLVLSLCLAAGYWLLLPGDYGNFARSALATLVFSSNIYFWRDTGYFSVAASEKPLLHTWSLGIEEQFYILFPFLLLLCVRFLSRRQVFWVLAALSLASLALAEMTPPALKSAAFYLLPARAWELALGSLLALNFLPAARPGLPAQALGIGGLALVGTGLFTLSAKTDFPGIAALLPCLGTTLLIHSGAAGTVAGRLLSYGAPVFIGRISYSLYLWHWPILAFLVYYGAPFDQAWQKTAILAAAILLSSLSWLFVESPFRNKNFLSRRRIYAFALAGTVLLGAAMFSIIRLDGLPHRFPAYVNETARAADDINPRRKACHTFGKVPRGGDGARPYPETCYMGSDRGNSVPDAVLWGNSHADAVSPAIDGWLEMHGLSGLQLSKSSCPPIAAPYEVGRDRRDCGRFNRHLLEYVTSNPEIRYVILAARWTAGESKIALPGSGLSKAQLFEQALFHTVETLRKAGKQVLVIGPIPDIDFNVPRCLSRAMAFPGSGRTCPEPTLPAFEQANEKTLPAFRRLAETTPVYFPHETLCRDGTCRIAEGGKTFYYDDDHLSTHGARYLVPGIESAMRKYGLALPPDSYVER